MINTHVSCALKTLEQKYQSELEIVEGEEHQEILQRMVAHFEQKDVEDKQEFDKMLERLGAIKEERMKSAAKTQSATKNNFSVDESMLGMFTRLEVQRRNFNIASMKMLEEKYQLSLPVFLNETMHQMKTIDLDELRENCGHSLHISEILKNGRGEFVPEMGESSNLSPAKPSNNVSNRASGLMSQFMSAGKC